MTVNVALLRGVNVGGKNLVPMKELATLFADEGCRDVRTFIQSGNVIFKADRRVLDGLAYRIGRRIAGRFGCTVPVVLRTSAELGEVVRNNPFLMADSPEERLHVYFLADKPAASDVAELDRQRSPPDSFVVRGSDIYLLLPNGAGYTKLTNAYFDSRLKTVSTMRNWRTILKLAEMTGAPK